MHNCELKIFAVHERLCACLVACSCLTRQCYRSEGYGRRVFSVYDKPTEVDSVSKYKNLLEAYIFRCAYFHWGIYVNEDTL